MGWSFGWDTTVKVECPELDALLSDLRAVFEKHGVAYELESGWGDERSKMILKPIAGADQDWMTDSLSDAEVPWIRRAIAEYQRQVAAISRVREESKRQAAADSAAKKRAGLAAAEEQRLDEMLRAGIDVRGKR